MSFRTCGDRLYDEPGRRSDPDPGKHPVLVGAGDHQRHSELFRNELLSNKETAFPSGNAVISFQKITDSRRSLWCRARS